MISYSLDTIDTIDIVDTIVVLNSILKFSVVWKILSENIYGNIFAAPSINQSYTSAVIFILLTSL